MLSSFLKLGNCSYTGSQWWNHPRSGRGDIHSSTMLQTSAFLLKVGRHKAIENATISKTETEESVERVRQYVRSGAYKQLLPSSYDTAWVAMVPDPEAPHCPCFPQCLEWILENQHDNGSWGSHMNMKPRFLKDNLSSTLACVLALKKWNCNANAQSIRKGLYFIRSNFSSIFDETLVSPLGFNIIFPGMLALAIDMGLDLSLGEGSIQEILSLQKLELNRKSRKNSEGRNQYLSYVAEGLGCLQDWNKIMKYQKSNGSLFHSPATTAAAYTKNHDEKAFNYLTSLVQNCGSSVPTIYPTEIYTQLYLIDTLERMGISHYFADDVQLMLATIHRHLLEGNEDVLSDMRTCALAFRLLRMNEFDVSSDLLTRFEEADSFHCSLQGYIGDIWPVIEIYKASQTKIFPNEEVLHKLESWSSLMLKDALTRRKNFDQSISQEVEYALKFPLYHGVSTLENKRYIEIFKFAKLQMLKTSTMSLGSSDAVLELAIKEFNCCQSLYREELNHLKRWFKDCKLDQLSSERLELFTVCYMTGLGTFDPNELSDARTFMAKNIILVTFVDDFCDKEGSIEELECLLSLIDRLGDNSEKKFYSKKVEILFSAIHKTITEMVEQAFSLQDRDITNHLVELWRNLFRKNLMERKYWKNNSLPTVKEYIELGAVTISVGVTFVPSLYFLHTEVSEEVIRHQDFHELLTLASICNRLLNDISTFEKEREEKSLNILSIYSIQHSTSLQNAKLEVKKIINNSTRELLRKVLDKDNATSKALREAFWKVCTIGHFLYNTSDEFSSPKQFFSMYDEVIQKPIVDRV